MATTTKHLAHGIEIRFEQSVETISATIGTRKPDPDWKHVDKKGHLHAWVKGKLPTLGEHVTGKTYVGDEYDGCEVDVTEYRCLVCAEVVEPKYNVSYEPTYIQGPPSWFLVLHPHIFGPQEFRIPDEHVHALVEIFEDMFGEG